MVVNVEELERREFEAREVEAGMWSKDFVVFVVVS